MRVALALWFVPALDGFHPPGSRWSVLHDVFAVPQATNPIGLWNEGMTAEGEIQFVLNGAGEPTAVIVPIALWQEIASERETAYLLKSETMRQRLHDALERSRGISLDDAVSKLRL